MIHLINNHFLKFIIIGLTLQLNYHIAKCQTYHPIPEDSTIAWRMHFEFTDFGACHEIFLFGYILKGDTIISTRTYKKVYIENSTLFSHTQGSLGCSNPPVNGYIAAFRQDTINKKAYLVLPNTMNDTLLYNFSLFINDTLNSITLPNGFSLGICVDSVNVIYDIDTLVINNENHILQLLSCVNKIVEEFGSLNDPFGAVINHRVNKHLICVRKDSIILFDVPAYSQFCSQPLNIKNINSVNKIKIFYDWIHDLISIHSDEQIENLKIFNINGKLLTSLNVNSEKTKITIAEYSYGIYILQIKLKNETIYKKIFKY